MSAKDEESELLKTALEYYREMDEKNGEPPSAKALDGGYNQTYIIMTNDDLEAKFADGNEVFFRCGNWCYKGLVQFNDVSFTADSIPLLIPMLQKQQGSLRYYCNSKSVPVSSDFSEPLQFFHNATEFIANQLMSEDVTKELRKMASVFPWIDDDNAPTYFELTLGDLPSYMRSVSIMASKTYTRGLVIISIYCDGVIYFVMQSGEGDQPLLDVRFPDVSRHGQGLHIDTFMDHSVSYRKLTLWHNLGGDVTISLKEIPKIRTINVSSSNYEQTYIILKSSWETNSAQLTIHHDVLFRFGSWCYSGRVQLTPQLSLVDIPYVIPALRMQQSRLDFLCDVNAVPTTSPFAAALGYMRETTPLMEGYILQSEDILKDLIDRLTNMGLGESVSKWLEGDPSNSFFEFKMQPDKELMEKFKNVELIVSKSYHSTGIITITIVFQHTIYVCLLENAGESPLLDSRFPDVSGKGRGYQLQAFNTGTKEWSHLRKVSIWQTVGALEQEFRQKAQQLAQSKDEVDDAAEAQAMMSSGSFKDSGGGGVASTVAAAAAADKMSDSKETTLNADSKTARNNSMSDGSNSPETEVPSSRADEKSPSRNIQQQQQAARSAISTPTSSATATATATGAAAPTTMVTDAKAGSGGAVTATAGSKTDSPSSGGASHGAPRMALPHHIPKMDGLSNRLDDIRKTMGDQGMKAPWDMKGKPLGSAGGSAPLGKTPLGKPPLGSIGGGGAGAK